MVSKKKGLEKLTLTAQIRTILGKNVRKLRNEGLIPSNIFGPGFKSTSISIQAKDLIKTYKYAKETGIVYIQLDKDEIPVLIKTIQKHPVTNSVVHVDFRKIDLNKKVITDVPVQVIGKSIAVEQKNGVLLTQLTKLTLEALPQDIPHSIEISVDVFTEIGQEIKVSDLPKSSVYEIKDEPTKVILSVVAHKEESITPETTVATPEVLTEAKVEEDAVTDADTQTPAAPEAKEKKENKETPKTTKEIKK